MGQVKEGTYRTGYYFDSPQSSTVIKSKMVATTILRTRTRFCPPKKTPARQATLYAKYITEICER